MVDCQGVEVGPRRPAGLQGVHLLFVLGEGAVGIVPRAEVMEFAPDLLRPDAGGVGEEREVGPGLVGLFVVVGLPDSTTVVELLSDGVPTPRS